MAVYRELDGDLVREYPLDIGTIVRKQTERALVEIVPTKAFGRTLFVDGELQLAEQDEYIYHEALVHPCVSTSSHIQDICILGGGDGCAARELLKWQGIRSIDILDWDKEVTRLFREEYSDINKNSLHSSKVRVENVDVRDVLSSTRSYTSILVDLLDPDFTNPDQRNLWCEILRATNQWIVPGGTIVINAGGITPWSTETLNGLLEEVKRHFDWPVRLYKVFVPSFCREWCFLLLNQEEVIDMSEPPEALRYFSRETWKQAYSNGWCKEYQRTIRLNLESQVISETDT